MLRSGSFFWFEHAGHPRILSSQLGASKDGHHHASVTTAYFQSKEMQESVRNIVVFMEYIVYGKTTWQSPYNWFQWGVPFCCFKINCAGSITSANSSVNKNNAEIGCICGRLRRVAVRGWWTQNALPLSLLLLLPLSCLLQMQPILLCFPTTKSERDINQPPTCLIPKWLLQTW